MPYTQNFTLETTSTLAVAFRHCDLPRNTLASKATQEKSAMEYGARIMVLVPSGVFMSLERR